MRYQTKSGDSPSRIARAYGLPMSAVINANPHKPTKMVAGQRTWESLTARETINVPVGGTIGDSFGLGDPAADVVNLLMIAGGPCLQANVGYVCQIQSILGVTVDGKYGSVTAAALRALVPSAPPGCSPTPAWWAPKGSNKCGTAPTASVPQPAPIPVSVPSSQQSSTFIDPCNPENVSLICEAQRAMGLTVDGKYGPATAAAAKRIDPSAPGPCTPRPSWWKPTGQSNCPGAAAPPPPPQPPPTSVPSPVPQPVFVPQETVPAPTPSVTQVVVPAPVAALANINPCLESSLDVVYAAQRALGVSPDGKYGNDTATAARRLLPTAPAACEPRPAWWAPKGQSNVPGGGIPVTTPPPRPPQPAPPVVVDVPPSPPPTPVTPSGGGMVVAPEPAKKISTGAIVAGAIGAVALVGVVAVAMGGKRGSRGARGKRGSRGPARRKSSSRKRR